MGDSMMEVLFTCDTNDNNACNAWDFRTGTNLMSYKIAGGGNVQQNTLSILRSEYVLSANSTKPLLHVWAINSQEQLSTVRFVVPGRVNTMAISADGYYLVAGIQETLYIWHLTTGRMLNTINKHYQPVNCVRFTDCGTHFISAGQDGGVLVWNLSQVVAQGDDNQRPLYTFTDHGLAVTDVHVGFGGMRAYIITVSLDRTCKFYNLSSGTLLLSVVFGEALHSVVCNAMETCVYVGTAEGNIYEFHIDSAPRTKEYHIESNHTNRFSGHKANMAVNCLVLSMDGQTLISGAQDQQICIWNIESRQLVKAMPQKGCITNMVLRLTNPAIFNPEHKQPRVFSGNLKRMIEPPDDDEIIEVLVTENHVFDVDEFYETNETKASEGTERIFSACSTDSENIKTTVDNSDELEKLRAEVQHLRRVNKQLFDVTTKELLRNKK